MRDRLMPMLGGRSWAEIARATGMHQETVRRQLCLGQPPPVGAAAAFASLGGASLDYIAFGDSPKTRESRVAHALESATVEQLLDALAQRVRSGEVAVQVPELGAQPSRPSGMAPATLSLVVRAGQQLPGQSVTASPATDAMP